MLNALSLSAAIGLVSAGIICVFYAAASTRNAYKITAEWDISMRSLEHKIFTTMLESIEAAKGPIWKQSHNAVLREIMIDIFGELEGRRMLTLPHYRLASAIEAGLSAKDIDEVSRKSLLMHEYAKRSSGTMTDPEIYLGYCAHVALEAEFLRRTAKSRRDAERAQQLVSESLIMLMPDPFMRRPNQTKA